MINIRTQRQTVNGYFRIVFKMSNFAFFAVSVAQRTKTGINKIVSTFKAGTLDAVNSGAIVAGISNRATGGGSNSSVAKTSTVYSGHADSVWDVDWHWGQDCDVIASASSGKCLKS